MYKILIVDDDALVIESLTTVLEDAGYNTISSSDGRQVGKLISSEHPDLILLDIVMPAQEGIETIMSLRKENITLPIFAMSSYEQDYLEMAKRLGADQSFNKPVDIDKLLAAISETLSSSAGQ